MNLEQPYSSGPDLFVNRELSWLEFSRRVTALTGRADFPLLEKARFLAIWATNLDEFFQVRVAGPAACSHKRGGRRPV